jgi:hypothetical protein
VVNTVHTISELLSTHGGWGLFVGSLYVMRWMWLRWEKERDGFNTAMEARHTEFTALLKETQATLGSIGVVIQQCRKDRNDG